MSTRAQTLTVLLLTATLFCSKAQELVVVVGSPAFTLNTSLAIGANAAALVATAESSGFTLDTRLSSGSAISMLVVKVESPSFTLDTRLGAGDPTLAVLVVAAESAAFVLDTRLAGKPEYLIVEAISPPFELNTMWLGIRRTARPAGSPLELFWPTNAPGFYPQSALPPLGPSIQWQDMTINARESGGFYRTLLNPDRTERYFRLNLQRP